jgi:porphyrinogen peroxidase
MTSARRAHGGGPDVVGSVSSAQPQPVLGPATATVLVLVLTVRHGVDCCSRVRALCEDVGDLTRSVDSQDPHTGVSCVVGFGAQVWPRLFGLAAPDQLRPFAPIRGHRYDAPATPGDVFFHIRSDRADLCFELGTRILARLDGAVTAVDEVQGFRYFGDRNLLGFVNDGTPKGLTAAAAALIGGDDPEFEGGTFAVVQKYLHDLTAWNGLSVQDQERIIGRAKRTNRDLGAGRTPSAAHRVLATFGGEGGRRPPRMLRDYVPFGSPAVDEFGTYFIGYAATPSVVEATLRNIYLGCPPGNYDRLLDFSCAVTGCTFFCPSQALLRRLAAAPPATARRPDPGPLMPAGDGGLRR